MNWKTSNWRIWLFRGLVCMAAVMMLISFIKPWWIGRFGIAGNTAYIYGWGFRHNLASLSSYVAGDVTPLWQVVLAWVYVGASIGLAFYSTWLKKWRGSLLLGFIGLGLISYAAVAINIVVKNRLDAFRIPLEGLASIDESIYVYADLQSAYYLAYIAGGIMIILSLLRGVIPLKNKVNRP